MIEHLMIRLIVISLLAMIVYEVNIISVTNENAKSIKAMVNQSVSIIQKFYNSISSPK